MTTKVATPPVATPSNGKQSARIGPEIGAAGLRQWYGRIDEEWLPELKYDKRFKVWREMADNDPTIGALLRAMTSLARQVDWHFEHEDDTDERIAFLETVKRGMVQSWGDFTSEALYGELVFGFAFHEIVYQTLPGGAVGWAKFAPRAQESLDHWVYRMPEERELVAFAQRPAPKYQLLTIPLSKAVHVVSESRKDNPEGVSVLRNCYRPWYFKKHIENIEAIGIERDLAGLPVVWGPARLFDSTASATDVAVLDELKRIVTNIRRDEQEGVAMPLAYDEHGNKLFELTLLSTAGDRQFDTSAIISRYDLRILQTVMADFLQLGHESVGSFALASSKTNLFAVSLGCYLDQIAEPINHHAIPTLLELNGLSTEDPPKLVHGDIETQDLAEFGAFLQACSNAGMPLFPDREVENKLRIMLGLVPLSSVEWDARQAERDAQKMEQQALMLEQAQGGAEPEGSAAVT